MLESLRKILGFLNGIYLFPAAFLKWNIARELLISLQVDSEKMGSLAAGLKENSSRCQLNLRTRDWIVFSLRCSRALIESTLYSNPISIQFHSLSLLPLNHIFLTFLCFFWMVRSTILARLSDGLPLAASNDDDELVSPPLAIPLILFHSAPVHSTDSLVLGTNSFTGIKTTSQINLSTIIAFLRTTLLNRNRLSLSALSNNRFRHLSHHHR